MKTNFINGSRTPEVINNELRKYGKLEGRVNKDGGLSYHYYTTPRFGTGLPAVEVTFIKGHVVATRQIDEAALKYLLPDRKNDNKVDTNFKFGGF